MLRLFKYGILFLALAGVLTVIYFRFIKKPMPYEGWPIVQKHACVYGAYYFSYLFRSELDNSKINSECTQQVSSNSEVDKFKIGLFCGKGMALAYDRGQIDQSNFLKKGKDDLLSEDHAKTVELVRLCIKAIKLKFDPIYQKFNPNSDINSLTVVPPDRSLYREFTNIRCDVASSRPCFD